MHVDQVNCCLNLRWDRLTFIIIIVNIKSEFTLTGTLYTNNSLPSFDCFGHLLLQCKAFKIKLLSAASGRQRQPGKWKKRKRKRERKGKGR